LRKCGIDFFVSQSLTNCKTKNYEIQNKPKRYRKFSILYENKLKFIENLQSKMFSFQCTTEMVKELNLKLWWYQSYKHYFLDY
jgi:hypothetical protein